MTTAIKTTDNGPIVVNIIDKQELAQAKRFWTLLKKRGTKDRQGWNLIGKVCIAAKLAYESEHGKPMPKQDFGKWTREQFDGIRPELISYAQKLHEDFDAINAYAEKHCPDLNTPKHLVSAYRAYLKKQEEAETPETSEAPNMQDLDKVRKEVNAGLLARILRDTTTLDKAIKSNTIDIEPAEAALLKNRLQGILDALNIPTDKAA